MPKSVLNEEAYYIEQLKRMESYAQKIYILYIAAIKELAQLASNATVDPNKPFSFDDYPILKKRAEQLFSQLSASIISTINDGTEAAWLFANAKNDALVDKIVSTTRLTKEQVSGYKQPNLKALEAFQTRKTGNNRLGLSDRVWKYTQQFKSEIEMGLDIGIGEGKSAVALSRDLKQYLQAPDKLFRRVRDKHGNLQLSKHAKAYHPGRGVYRSSAKNALRLTREEINRAYHESDYQRWQKLDFVVGIEVKLSRNHLKTDICDHLKGKYPKDFKFTGWHTQCFCHAVSILATPDEFIKSLNEDTEISSPNTVTSVPSGFNDWVEANKDRVSNWKSMPNFIKDNFKEGDLNKGLK